MKTLRRFNIKDSYYFITSVTHNRNNILTKDIDLFWDCWKQDVPEAWVILPDHFHVVIKIKDENISKIMHRFKITFSRRFRDKHNAGRVWQNRFWDHIIRDQEDMNRHIDYIHFNPVKHGLLNDPFEYKYSSLMEYFSKGHYSRDWGVIDKPDLKGEYGE